MSLNDMDSPESGNGKFAFPNMGDEPKVISQVSWIRLPKRPIPLMMVQR